MHTSNIVRAACSLVAALVAPAAGATQHQFGDMTITVVADPVATLSPEYQVTVENPELLLTRLSAPLSGTLSNSFVADLNKDGRFEVVVTFTHADGLETEVRVFTWNEYLLEPIRLNEPDPTQMQGYRGGDEFAVKNDELVRMFQIYEQVNGEWTATAARRELRYSFAASRWTD